jgi:hypothetical protein
MQKSYVISLGGLRSVVKNVQVWDNYIGALLDRFWQGVTIRFWPCRILENKIEFMNEFTFNVLSVRLGKPDLKL